MSSLTQVQKELLSILESFMHDKPYKLPEDFVEVQQLFRLAQIHKIASIVYEKVRTDSIWKKEEYKNLLPWYKRIALKEIMLQVQRTDGFLTLYEKLKAEGVEPLIMKGLICRNLYSEPDYRISGDEDMLLPKEQFTKCDEILLREGFGREELKDTSAAALSYEIPYINRKNGVYIELHFMLMKDTGAYGHFNKEFEKVHEQRIEEEIQGKRVYTLCPTEHLFYLICHSFKHFLHSGFGIRQVADMIMMAEHYGSQIDWKMIEEKLVRLSMKKYWDALVRIGVEYLGFSLEKAAYPKSMYDENVDFEPLLMDLLDSGVYGDSSLERKHSSNMTLTAAAKGKTNTIASVGASLFPDKSYMMRSFAWLEKYPWLLPIAYLIRIVGYLKNREKSNDNGKNSVQIGVERVELLRKYEIIE